VEPVHDFVKFRTFGPLEIEHHLALHGFETLDIYDNDALAESELRGSISSLSRASPARRDNQNLDHWRLTHSHAAG
jgi:hypothetical protein